MDWEELRKRALKVSFPSLYGVYIREPEVRKAVIEALASKGEETAYGLSLSVGKPLPSVVKALKALEEKGYVVAEVKPFKRKREVTVYKLSELGEVAYLTLKLPDYDLSKHLEGEDPVSEDLKNWVGDPCLKQLFSYAILAVLPKLGLEQNHSEIRKSKIIMKYAKKPVYDFLIKSGYILLTEVLTRAIKTIIKEPLEQHFKFGEFMLVVEEEYDMNVIRLEDNLLRLVREREDIKEKLLKALSKYLFVKYCTTLTEALGYFLIKVALDSGGIKSKLRRMLEEKAALAKELKECFGEDLQV